MIYGGFYNMDGPMRGAYGNNAMGYGGRGGGPMMAGGAASPYGGRGGAARPMMGGMQQPGMMQGAVGPNAGMMGGGAGMNGMAGIKNPNSSFMMGRQGSFMGNPAGSNASLMGGFRPFGSFNYGAPGSFRMPGGAYSSMGAGSLQRINSGLNFDYSYDGFNTSTGSNGQPMSRNGSYMSGGLNGAARQGSELGGSSYNFGSFRGDDGFANGASGAGPNVSTTSLGPPTGTMESGAAEEDTVNTGSGADTSQLQRLDSQNSLQRHFSIAGQFSNFSQYEPPTAYHQAGGGGAGAMPMNQMGGLPDQRRLSTQGRYPQQQQAPGMMMTLNGANAMLRPMGMQGAGPMVMNGQPVRGGMMMPRPYPTQGNDGGMKGGNPEDVVEEGQPQALGRKNSVGSMKRKDSEKRIGMYFKNKAATDTDGVQYKKEGDPGTSKASGANKDPSLVNYVRSILLLDKTGNNRDLEIDGRTVRAMKPGADEVQKYDMRDVIYVHQASDLEVNGDSLEELRDTFVYGCNVGMVMADADCDANDPSQWFTWLALKTVVKGTFAKLPSNSEFTVSICLLQDDQVMDLLADSPRRFVNLAVAESPLFGSVANGLVYICVDDAGEFNDTLDTCLARARGQGSGEEHGIVLVTCVLKQIRTSQSTGKKDVVVSSIFASGVGDGVIHYNRILDKNPAEPRALFYSVLHRSTHTSALFSCKDDNPELINYLATLQRFSKVETRKPKVGSALIFMNYAKQTIPRVKEDLKTMKEGKNKTMTLRFLERLELMSMDCEKMLESPEDCIPKTYI